MSDLPVVEVNLSKKIVSARLPIEFDRSGWFAEFHGAYMLVRRAHSREVYSIDYETLISRAIAAEVATKRKRRA